MVQIAMSVREAYEKHAGGIVQVDSIYGCIPAAIRGVFVAMEWPEIGPWSEGRIQGDCGPEDPTHNYFDIAERLVKQPGFIGRFRVTLDTERDVLEKARGALNRGSPLLAAIKAPSGAHAIAVVDVVRDREEVIWFDAYPQSHGMHRAPGPQFQELLIGSNTCLIERIDGDAR